MDFSTSWHTRSFPPSRELAAADPHEYRNSAQLGHSSTAVTDRYLRKIAPTELVAQVRDRSRLEA
jgi:hypothetical protein